MENRPGRKTPFAIQPPVLERFGVKLLDVQGLELGQGVMADGGVDVVTNNPLVLLKRLGRHLVRGIV